MSEDATRNLPQDGVERILARLDTLDARFDKINAGLTRIEVKMDRLLQESYPTWEQVPASWKALVKVHSDQTGLSRS